MAGSRFTDAERNTIARLHGEGLSARAIGREIGRPPQSVSRVAKDMGLAFDHAQTAAATKARAVDMKGRRAELAARSLDEAERFLDDLHKPFMAYAFAQSADPDNRFAQHLAMPGPADKAALMRAFSAALSQHLKLADFDGDSGLEETKSMLGELHKNLQLYAANELDGDFASGNDPV